MEETKDQTPLTDMQRREILAVIQHHSTVIGNLASELINVWSMKQAQDLPAHVIRLGQLVSELTK